MTDNRFTPDAAPTATPAAVPTVTPPADSRFTPDADTPPASPSSDARFQVDPLPEPNMAGIKAFTDENLKAAKNAENPKPATNLLEAIEAGWGGSVTGLIQHGKMPDKVLPQDAGWAMRLASMSAGLAGDVPAMLAGGLSYGTAGAIAGTVEAPVVGTIGLGAAGLAYGSWAAPAGIRRILMDHYEKGDIKDPADFLQRAFAATFDSFKGGIVGLATAGVGGGIGGKLAETALAPSLQTGAKLAGELATMTTVGKAMEGHLPKFQDYTDAGLLLAVFHGVTHAAEPASNMFGSKLRDIYSQTGLRPEQVVEEAKKDPSFMQELADKNNKIPSHLESLVDPLFKKEEPKVSIKAEEANNSVLVDSGQKSELLLPKEEKASAAPGGKEPPELPPENKAIRERWAASEPSKENVTMSDVWTSAIDDLHPVKELENLLAGGKKLPSIDSPYESMRRSKGAYGVADNFIKNGPSEFNSRKQTGTPGIEQILEPHKTDLPGLNDYLISKGAIELSGRGIETGVPLDAAKAVVAKGKAQYEKAAKQLIEYRNDTLEYLKDSGILSEKDYDLMIEQNERVPFYRHVESEKMLSPGKRLAVKNPIKGIEGSSLKIVDPIESIIKETYQRVTLAERNGALEKLAVLHDETPNSGFIEKVKTTVKPIEVSKEEIQKYLDDNGLAVTAEDPFAIFRPNQRLLAPDEFAVFRKGKREIYRVDKGVAEAIKGLDQGQMDAFVKLVSIPAKTLRAGTVAVPDFLARNALRDQWAGYIFSDNGYRMFIDAVMGLKHIVGNDEVYQYFKKSGGGIAAAVSIDRDYIQNNIFELSKKTGLIDSIQNVIKNPLQLFQVWSENLENATRVGEFARATRGDFSPENLAKAGFAARDVTVDYQRVGAKMRAMNSMTAFFNAQVQGVVKLGEAMKKDPVGTTAKAVASVTLPSLYLWWVNKDDPRYIDAPQWEKDTCWFIPTKNTMYRFPKPFEIGIIFGTLPERILDGVYRENPDALKGFGDTLVGALTPSVLPTAAVPVLEKWANKSTFTGSTIVPSRLEKVLPAEQYTPYTSETAKMLGKIITSVPGMKSNAWASPIIIDNTVRAWSGNVGKYAVNLADQALYATGAVPRPVHPEATLADMPFIKAFVVRYPTAASQQVQDFYDNYNESQTLINTAKLKLGRGDVEGSVALRQAAMQFGKLSATKDSISNISKAIQAIDANPQMDPHEKRQLIDNAYTIMINQAKLANERVKELKKVLK